MSCCLKFIFKYVRYMHMLFYYVNITCINFFMILIIYIFKLKKIILYHNNKIVLQLFYFMKFLQFLIF